MKNCILCGEEIHPKRLEILPYANKCVKCSDTKPKSGITITKGKGDHTYTETIIMEHNEYIKYKEIEFKIKGERKDDGSFLNEEDDEIESPENDEPTELI
jgi:hypothetical protein